MIPTGQTQAQQPIAVKSVQFQTSSYGVGVPLVYGTTRISNNLIWYGDFVAAPIPAQSGGK